jgi:hypothetical protein
MHDDNGKSHRLRLHQNDNFKSFTVAFTFASAVAYSNA